MDARTIDHDETLNGGAQTLLSNRYRIVRQLGQGGMGSVWLAEDTQLDGKLFAIKMLPSILVSNKRAYQQLKAEALVSMRLTHPNIVTLRAFEENNGNPFLVMDYVDGQTLDDYLAENGKLTEDEAIGLLKPIASALDYAHAEGVVHRDVKPANVMIRKDGHPFILDFGIAREIQETMTRVTGKLSSGTLLYMSPEQLNGDAPKAPQDVYSFAAMVYECLTGHPPFYRGAIEDQIKNKEPDPPAALSIAASVMAGLAKRPEDRPKCCAAVLAGGEGFNAEKRRCGGAEGEEAKFDRAEHVGEGGLGHVNALKGNRINAGGLGKALAGLLVLAAVGGVVWFATRTADDAPAFPPLPPVVTNVVVNPPLPPSGPTEADVTEISVEASVQKGRVERIDDADGFKRRKNQLSDLLTEAVSYGKVKRWDKAAVCFTNYVDNCIALTELDRRRYEARDARTKSTSARKRAEAADSSKYASVRWNAALKIAADAVAAFDSMRFSDATRYYETAMKQFEMCADDAKKERQRQETVRLENERNAAGDARARALSASKRAEQAGAKKYAQTSWNAAAEKWKYADAELKKKRFAVAVTKFSELERMFDSCAREADKNRRAKWRKDNEDFTIQEPYGFGMKMKWCPAGSFVMGSPVSEEGRRNDEIQHKVILSKGFWVGETEVTQGQWKRIMNNETVVDLARKGLYDDTLCCNKDGKTVTLREYWGMNKNDDPNNRCGDLKDNVPVYNITWFEAVEFCKRLTAQEKATGRIPDGYEFRLPTEAEWEYACRAGTDTIIPNGKAYEVLGMNNIPALDDIAWYGGNSSVGFNGRGVDTADWKEKQYPGGRAFAREVKGKQPNNWGFYDMMGNVWEWCYDINGGYSDNITDPVGASFVGASFRIGRVLRGGSWLIEARFCRSAQRAAEKPHYRRYDIGFRVALAPSHPGMIYPEAPAIIVPKEDEKEKNFRLAKDAFKAKRYDEAYRLFMKSDLNDKEVQYFMGHLYGSGHGVQKNEYEAVKWYRKAAEQGHCGAQVFLGVRYANGQGVVKDEYEAIKWYRKAAEQGHAGAQIVLGLWYSKGRGVVKDEYEAIKWFRKAAELGNVFSSYKLGEMYENGRGVLRDIEEAKKWYRKAAEKGDQNAKKALERLENIRVVKPVKYVQPIASQPQQPVLIDRPHNLKYCDNCGHALWRLKKISPRCEKCGTILFKPEAPQKDTTGKDVEALGNLLRGIGGGL